MTGLLRYEYLSVVASALVCGCKFSQRISLHGVYTFLRFMYSGKTRRLSSAYSSVDVIFYLLTACLLCVWARYLRPFDWVFKLKALAGPVFNNAPYIRINKSVENNSQMNLKLCNNSTVRAFSCFRTGKFLQIYAKFLFSTLGTIYRGFIWFILEIQIQKSQVKKRTTACESIIFPGNMERISVKIRLRHKSKFVKMSI